MISITMTETQYKCAIVTLEKTEGVTLTPTSDTTGHLHVENTLDADYEYREVGNSLVLTNEQKHGLARFASEDTIGSHMVKMLGDLKCPELTVTSPSVSSEPSTGKNAPAQNAPQTDSNQNSGSTDTPLVEPSDPTIS
jgi:hypothetical protein